MYRRTKVCSGLMLAFGGTLALSTPFAFGQAQLERVEITGSSIRRIDAESALPVVTLKREEIVRSGATSLTDLLNKLPTIQGATKESGSVGPTSFGFAGISVHNIGETRTLVLLNGHRLAQFGGQTLTGSEAAFDLNSIPVSAIERIEILTDGASALYGADAIAGVVNFITKRDITEGDITLGYSSPKDGAREKRISATKGFGSLSEDGYNVMLTLSHDERTHLNSTSRSFANTGRVFFNANGKSYRFQQFSASPIPANVVDDAGNLINPYQKVNGTCAPGTFRVIDGSDDYCGFDFVSQLEIYPERKRDNFVGSFNKKFGDQELFVDLLYSRSQDIDRVAPVPGSLSIPAGSALHDKYLLPLGITQDTLAFYRLADLGKRTNDNIAKFYDFAFGSRGTIAGWDYKAVVTQSESDVKGSISGFPGALALARLRSSGLLDPFVLPGQQSAAAQAAINSTNYSGYFDGGVSKLDTIQLNGSRELMKLPAGPLMLGTGVNFNRERFTSKPSLFAQGALADPVAGTLCDPTGANPALACDQRFGDAAATQPYTASRKSYGVFGELIIPALKTLEFGLAARYDHYSDFGSATTGKASFRWNPTGPFLLRGSVGTGFHAPTVPQLNAAARPFGVTSDKYPCTPELQAQATAQGAQCRPGSQQYDQLAGGNKSLSPEKSRQATLGIVFEPTPNITTGIDLWHVEIRDAFGQLSEQTVFANPAQFSTSWSSNRDVGTGVNYLAFLANNRNLGKQFSTGLDLDFTGRAKTGWGDLVSQFNLTYMIREQQQLESGGPYFSAIGNNAELGTVTFRWQGRWQTSLKTGNWTNTVGLNFKSGYRDQLTTVDVLDAAGNITGSEDIRLDVSTYYTMDLQSQWTPIKNFAITFGVLNVFNRNPPFSIGTSGTNRGQQFGYDDRYYDPRGRTLYANASYKF
jgi:iron complex outermembrane receptor protein